MDRQTAACLLDNLIGMVEDTQENYYDTALRMGIEALNVQSVRHGHWIIKDNPGTGWYRVTCSECGEDVTSVAPVIGFFPNARVTWDFCPYCGADMRGEQNDG